MRSNILIFYFIVSGFLISCKKENSEQPIKDNYVQYFKGIIADKPLEIKGSISVNRDIFHGSWSLIGNSDGTSSEMYTVNVQIPKEVLETKINSKLQFQIFNIETGEYFLKSNLAFQKDFSTHIYLVTDLGMPASKTYTTIQSKPAFKILISRYEKPKNGSVPFVEGTLSGVLYNTKDLQDSIVVKDASFGVRF